MTTALPASVAVLHGPRPAPAPGLPRWQGTVLAVLWEAPMPLTAAQVAARLGRDHPAGTGYALGRR